MRNPCRSLLIWGMLLNDPTECFTVLGQIKFRQVLALKNRAINEALLEVADNISIYFSNTKLFCEKEVPGQ